MPITNLQSALVQAEFSGLTDQQALDHGNGSVVVSSDSTPYTWSGIGEKLLLTGVNPSVVLNMRATLSGLPNGGPTLDGCFLSGGFDCSSDANRGLLAGSLVTDPPDAVTLIDAMLAIGQTMGTRWQLWGVSQPVLADITAARAATANQQAVATLFNEVLEPNRFTKTLAELQALVAAFEV